MRGENTRKLRKKGFSSDNSDRIKSSKKNPSGGRKKKSLNGEIDEMGNTTDPAMFCIKSTYLDN